MCLPVNTASAGESGAGGEAGISRPLKNVLYVEEICQAVLKDYLKVFYLCKIFFFLPPVLFRVFLQRINIYLRVKRKQW